MNTREKNGFLPSLLLSLAAICVSACTQNYGGAHSSTGSQFSDASAFSGGYQSLATGNQLIAQPASTSVTPGGTVVLSASGGTPPYTYAIFSGTGQILYGNEFQASMNIGDLTTLDVTDSAGDKVYFNISVVPSTPNPSSSPGGGLTLSASPTPLYYAGSTSLTASGGTGGGYTFTIPYGEGNLLENYAANSSTSVTYVAPSVTTVVTVTVTDSGGDVATVNIPVNSPNYNNGSGAIAVDQHMVMSFAMPQNTGSLGPSFIFGEAGSKFDFGAGVNEQAGTDLTTFAPAPASQALVISNYDSNDPSPVTGQLSITGTQGGTMLFDFCFVPGQPTAYLNLDPSSRGTVCMFTSNTAYTFGSIVSGVPPGTTTQSAWLENINSPQKGAGSVTVQYTATRSNHSISNCNAYAQTINSCNTLIQLQLTSTTSD